MRLPRLKKANPSRSEDDYDNKCNTVSGGYSVSKGLDASTELKLLTRKHSFLNTNRSLSMNISKKDKKIITYTAAIDSIDGIIATKTGRLSLDGEHSQPVFAVISYYKKVASTGNTVKTNILSLPLVKSKSSIGNRERFYANFSEDSQLQSFSLSAAMRTDSSYKSGFEPRELDFEISLMRGSEVVKLGTSTLVLNGDEDGSMQMIAVNSTKAVTNTVRKTMAANKPRKTTTSSVSTAGAKMVSFTSDASRKYTLQRSVVRLSVHIQVAEKTQTQYNYLHDPSNVPSSMMLSIGHSDSVSCLSSGGVTTHIYKERTTHSTHKSDDLTGKGFRKLDSLNTGSHDFKMFSPMIDEQDDSSDSGTDARDDLRIPSLDSSEWRETPSDDDSALLDEVSLGTIHFKGIESSDGFEVISK